MYRILNKRTKKGELSNLKIIKMNKEELRNEIAFRAMQGELCSQSDTLLWSDYKILANRCFDIADAMMEVISERNTKSLNDKITPMSSDEIESMVKKKSIKVD